MYLVNSVNILKVYQIQKKIFFLQYIVFFLQYEIIYILQVKVYEQGGHSG